MQTFKKSIDFTPPMKTLIKRIGLTLIVTLLFLVAAWNLAAQDAYQFTYDGREYSVGGTQLDVQGYRIIPTGNYKAYRMGARDVPYVYTGVDVAPQVTQVVQQVPVQETVYVQKTEPQVVAKVPTEPVVIQSTAAPTYNENEYQPSFSSVELQTRPIVYDTPTVQNVALPAVQVEGVDTHDVENLVFEDTNEQEYLQDINHYHEINRQYTHNYLHNLKQVHNHHYNVVDHHQNVHYTTEHIEQNYFEPTYSTVYHEPIIHEPVRDEAAEYEVVGIRTYEVPVTRVRYESRITTGVTPGMPLVTPVVAYPRPFPPGIYYGPPTGYGNWEYASNWK